MSEISPVPKLQPALISKESTISVALAVLLAGAIYSYGKKEGMADAREKMVDKLDERLETVEKNLIAICQHVKGCEIQTYTRPRR